MPKDPHQHPRKTCALKPGDEESVYFTFLGVSFISLAVLTVVAVLAR